MGSPEVSTHAPPHDASPGSHVHALPTQIVVAAHVVPQSPQLRGSLFVSPQAPPHVAVHVLPSPDDGPSVDASELNALESPLLPHAASARSVTRPTIRDVQGAKRATGTPLEELEGSSGITVPERAPWKASQRRFGAE